MVYTHVMSYYLFWKLTLLNLPRDMTLESSLAASFFSATFNTLQGLAILIAQLAVGAARVYSAQIMRMRIGRCMHGKLNSFVEGTITAVSTLSCFMIESITLLYKPFQCIISQQVIRQASVLHASYVLP